MKGKLEEHFIDKDKLNFEKREYLSGLFDFYGPLLKDKNRIIFEKYIIEDYGISEIAHETGDSRQAVYEVIRRVQTRLIKYEDKLKLFNRFTEEQDKIAKIRELMNSMELPENKKEMAQIFELLDELEKE
ncbi:MAG: hypothetical protein K6D02_02755 [Lachnospiraceae bacterium]|nr:hypothetical protein [Lachnospiraceae bacterium]